MACLRLGPHNRAMHRIVHSLAMSLVLYHVLVGCCWHHAHAESAEPSGETLQSPTCCQHHHEDGREPADLPHPHDGGCDGESCDFVVPHIDGPPQLDETAVASLVDLDLASRIQPSSGALGSEIPPPGGLPPLRLHLLNQILLI